MAAKPKGGSSHGKVLKPVKQMAMGSKLKQVLPAQKGKK